MSDTGPKERAEAAFGHLQHAASEMIAAAHDALDLLDQVVATAALSEILEGVNHLFRWSRPPPPAQPTSAQPTSGHSPVERISVH